MSRGVHRTFGQVFTGNHVVALVDPEGFTVGHLVLALFLVDTGDQDLAVTAHDTAETDFAVYFGHNRRFLGASGFQKARLPGANHR